MTAQKASTVHTEEGLQTYLQQKQVVSFHRVWCTKSAQPLENPSNILVVLAGAVLVPSAHRVHWLVPISVLKTHRMGRGTADKQVGLGLSRGLSSKLLQLVLLGAGKTYNSSAESHAQDQKTASHARNRWALRSCTSTLVSFPDYFSPHGKNWSGERPIPFSFPVVAKIETYITLVGM